MSNLKIERVLEVAEADECLGFCTRCGAEIEGVEPNVRNYPCPGDRLRDRGTPDQRPVRVRRAAGVGFPSSGALGPQRSQKPPVSDLAP